MVMLRYMLFLLRTQMNNLLRLPIRTLNKKLQAGEITSKQLVEMSLRNINDRNSTLNAFLTVEKEKALADAEVIDARYKNGEDLSLVAGIPFSVKDAFNVAGIETRSASKILEGYHAPYTATAIQKLLDAGAVFIGKNNQDSFGFGASTENSDYGVVKNPWNMHMVAGGSSGGSAAAIAADMGVFAIGEDTGGSIRLPANFCGVTGLKVTYGRVSRYGAIAFSSSLDTIGPITHHVEDAAVILEIIAGKDAFDATTLPQPVPSYVNDLDFHIDSMIHKKIGIPKEMLDENVQSEIRNAIESAAQELASLGFEIKEISMPFSAYGVASYYIMAPSEASSNLGRFDGIRYGLSERGGGDLLSIYKSTRTIGLNSEAKRRVMLGTYALSSGYYDAYFKKAQQIRTLMKQEFEDVFENVDAVLAPVAPILPFEIGGKSEDPLAMYLVDVFTIPVNIAGVPSLALPVGISAENLPIGMQLIGPQLSEHMLLRLGYAYQQKTQWHEKLSQ